MQNETQIEIHIAAAENKVTKVINHYGKKKTYHNGGFRIGVSIEHFGDFICITKSATYSGLAESWGVLRAVEWAIAQGINDLTVYTVDHCTSQRRKSGFFIKLAHAKAEVAGKTWHLAMKDNTVVGFCYTWPKPSKLDVGSFYVVGDDEAAAEAIAKSIIAHMQPGTAIITTRLDAVCRGAKKAGFKGKLAKGEFTTLEFTKS